MVRSRTADSVCRDAVDVARAAAEENAGPDEVGAHLGCVAEDERVVTHWFDCRNRAYRGWRWAVTVARAARAKSVTVAEVALVAGDEAVLAPPWVPWHERLRPGDVGPGDLLPTAADDERLTPAFFSTDDADVIETAFELGLGRARVLSFGGRSRAAERWYAGDSGPEAAIARSAPAECATCGFFVPLTGALRQAFGVCANEYATDDGQVVSADHGCGAHSEAVVLPSPAAPAPPLLDDYRYDVVHAAPERDHGSVTDSEPAEEMGHS